MKTATLIAILLLVGCAGSSARFEGTTAVEVRPDGTVKIDKAATSASNATAPDGASAASPSAASTDSATAASAPAWEAKVDAALASTWVYHIAAIALLIGAMVLLWMRQWTAAALAGGGALLAGAAPWMLPIIGKSLGWIVMLIIVAAGVYAAVHVWYKRRATDAALKLQSEGKPEEAIAARRAADPAYEAKYVAAKGTLE